MADVSLVQLAFGVVLFLLVAKAQALGAATASMRGKLKRFINKEDAVWLAGQHVEVDDPAVQRIFRAHRNDLEALVPFMIVGSLYQWSEASAEVGIAYFLLFLAARFAHTFAYLGGRAQMRRNMFTIAWLLIFVIGLHAITVLVLSYRSAFEQ